MKETVKNTSGSVVDLHDGRILGPGDIAEDVEMDANHNRTLADGGLITIIGSNESDAPPPKVTKETK